MSVSVPLKLGVPGVPLFTPPASVTAPRRRAGDDRGVIGAVDGDRHLLRGAILGVHREGVGEDAADVERLHRCIVIVERVGPGPARGHRVAAVAVVARRARSNRLEGVGRIVHIGVGQRAAEARRSRRTIVDPAASVTAPDVVPEMTAG